MAGGLPCVRPLRISFSRFFVLSFFHYFISIIFLPFDGLKASRPPWFAYEIEEATSAYAQATPPFAYAKLYDRPTTRQEAAEYQAPSQ